MNYRVTNEQNRTSKVVHPFLTQVTHGIHHLHEQQLHRIKEEAHGPLNSPEKHFPTRKQTSKAINKQVG